MIHDETSGAIAAAEVCEDLWVPIPPSTRHAGHGANVIVGLSASNETVGKSEYRKAVITTYSTKNMCGYIHTPASVSENTSDLVLSGHDTIANNGAIISESEIPGEERILYGEIDLGKCRGRRSKFHTTMQIQDSCTYTGVTIRTTPITQPLRLIRDISSYPFVSGEGAQRSKRCMQILHIQAAGLAQRLKEISCTQLIIGISEDLGSAPALLIAHMAFGGFGLSNKDVLTVTVPGFGTARRTHGNSHKLMAALHTSVKGIPIRDACEQYFHDIGHSLEQPDITYKNTQARERTQVLMDLTNTCSDIVLGTGDLNELALE